MTHPTQRMTDENIAAPIENKRKLAGEFADVTTVLRGGKEVNKRAVNNGIAN